MRISPCILMLFSLTKGISQLPAYSVSNAHSHNDYEQSVPLMKAYQAGFGSIEADVYLRNDQLLVAHEEKELDNNRTLEHLYLEPLDRSVTNNQGYPYADHSKKLLLLIDIKSEAVPTLNKLVQVLKKYPSLAGSHNLQFVISGNRPPENTYNNYPGFIAFDGELSKTYTNEALKHIALMSDNLANYTQWNGKGIVVADEWKKLQAIVAHAHELGKPVRFWNSPDFENAWLQLMKLGVDYINTDHIERLSTFLNTHKKYSYQSKEKYDTYHPTYKTDGVDKKVKNILLFIGDGTSFPQLYAAYTCNRANLNIFNFKNIGLSKTSSYDSYVTDSAPGSTAISAGEKTNNRHVGVDHTGKPLTLLPIILKRKNISTALVTCGDITDATPADFYAHQPNRDDAVKIIREMKNSGVELLIGSGNESLENVKFLSEHKKEQIGSDIFASLQEEYAIISSIDSMKNYPGKKMIVIDKNAGKSMHNGRGNWLDSAFSISVKRLSANKQGFFIMLEGAQIDYGGHSNNMEYVVTEAMDFDKVIGNALRFADQDGETLVLVTGDHETGGLTLLDGDYEKGYVSGSFSTVDHSALPVPVFAYGPRSYLFRGVYENTEIFRKILEALAIKI